MYKRTSFVEATFSKRRIEEDKAARIAVMAKTAKAGKGKGKAEDEGSSHGGSEAQAAEEVAGEDLARDETSGLEALATMIAKLQEEEEADEEVEPGPEWLAFGPQAPEPILDQRPHRRAANQGAVAPNPVPAARRVKKTTTRNTKTHVACRQSPSLAHQAIRGRGRRLQLLYWLELFAELVFIRAPSASAGLGAAGKLRRPSQKRGRASLPPLELELRSMLIDEE